MFGNWCCALSTTFEMINDTKHHINKTYTINMYACVYNVHIHVYMDANTIIEGKINVTSAKFFML